MKTILLLFTLCFFGAVGTTKVTDTKPREPEFHVLLPELVITPDKSEYYREGSVYNPIALEEVVITAKKI